MKYRENSVPATQAGTTETTPHLLVVDADARTVDLVRAVVQPGVHIRHAASIDAAQAEMRLHPAQTVLVNLQIADHGGIELIKTLKQRFGGWGGADIVALSRSRRGETCLDAFRAGASDILLAPFSPRDIEHALAASADRRKEARRRFERHERLRAVCRRLNKARHEISQQVDLLCNDLVHAYQDMAQQLNATQTAAEFAEILANELDVEGVLRRTMEWILKRLGPVNAAIYLPSGDDHFALGAYLNLDTQADAPLIDVIGKTIVAQARGANPLFLNEDATIHELFGDEGAPLCGRQWLAVGCHTPRECLAVLVIFRNKTGNGMSTTTNLNPQSLRFIEAAAPILAERIEQALGFFQRLHPRDEDESED
jgi:DNA-binding response OmpR family regulator